jgi:hypothetical protein
MNPSCGIACTSWLAEQLPALGRALSSGDAPQAFHIVQLIHLHALKADDWSPACRAALTDLIVDLRCRGVFRQREEGEVGAMLAMLILAGAELVDRADLTATASWCNRPCALVPILCQAKEMFAGRPTHADIAEATRRALTASATCAADVNAPSETGQRPIHIAVRRVNGPLVKVLLAHGADPYAVDPVAGKNAFRLAEALSAPQLSHPLESWRSSQSIGHIINRAYDHPD